MKTYSRLAIPELTRQLVTSKVITGDVQNGPIDHPAPRVLISQEGSGITESSAFDLDGSYGSGYMLSLHIATDLPALEIYDWRLDLPWEDPQFQWLPDPPNDIYEFPDHQTYPRDAVLNHRRVVHRGRSLDGLLLGFGVESIPESYRHGKFISASIVLIDGMGRPFPTSIQLWVDRAARRDRKTTKKNTRRRLFENRFCAEDELILK